MTLSSQWCENICKQIHDSTTHLVQALVTRTQLECRQIREKYKEMYGEDLIHNSSNSSSHGFLSMFMLNPHERDAAVAREAIQQAEINYRALLEVFVARKSSHVLLILQAYQARFRRLLVQDIISIEPAHPYQTILMALAASHRAHDADVSQEIAKCDARRLYQTGEGSPGAIDEAVVLEILSKRSIPQHKLTFASYKRIYGHSYSKSLKNENYGAFENALRPVVECIYNPPKYFAKMLYASIKGPKTDNGALARVLVSRAEVDMDEIQRAFKTKYGVELRDFMHENIPSGDFRDFLEALATKNHLT